ncbi:MAG: AAA family ATPase [Candidatus Electronema sp. V4]|uniref:AAA family ATPase n=1 Tax=Candidatus Electronema sp. V4 TaxID=3454756 RepID=UPI0040557A08
MITQLEIKNFRGFSEYKIDDVGQVNLLVGTNNCGKTSVLEAVNLLKSKSTSELFSIFTRRGECYERKDNSIPTKYGDLRRLFYGFQVTLGSLFGISSFNGSQEEASLVASIDSHSFYDDRLRKYPQFREHGSGLIFSINLTYMGGTEIIYYPVSNEGDVVDSPERELDGYATDASKKDDYSVAYIPPHSITTNRVIDLFNDIVLTDDEEFMLDAIRIIDPNIMRLAQLGGGYDEDRIRSGFFVKSSKWDERIPIGSFGDGIWRLLGLALSLVGAKNGTLLIDEIDTGLHHTVMSKMWKLICATAKKLNVQVFATTHSRDCWETLAENAIEDEFADMPIRIHRIDKDRKQAETFTNKEINLALNRELEVR